ncbi:hypothetical protein U6G28_04165 [Actinomycetaceae bacterium MB13-C1-2]|nr:hypothetical protein U6G28_04165 [Actinomycetaceae bacterium MB13-C1-2]
MRAEVDVSGVEEVELKAAAADFRIGFADVSTAVLSVEGEEADYWTLSREANLLKISSGPRRPLSGAGAKLLAGVKTNAVLTLPQALNDGRLVLELDIAACKFHGAGAFLAVEADLAASEFDLAAQVQEARIGLAAGKARVLLENTAKVELKIAAGSLSGWLKGGAPSFLRVEVATGSADLIVPPVPYRVKKGSVLGSTDLRVKEDASSPSMIDIEVAVGQVSIEPQVEPGAQL